MNISDHFKFGPRLKEIVLRLSWAIPVFTNIVTNKFDPRRKEQTLFQRKGETLTLTNLQLALEVLKGNFESWCPAEDVVNNNCGICLGIDTDATRRRDLLPSLIHVVDKNDKYNWTVDWPEGHDIVSELGTTRSGECQFGLRVWSNSYLMIA